MSEEQKDPLVGALDGAVEVSAGNSRRCELTFEQFFREYPPAANYCWGKHTYAIAHEIEEAIKIVEAGGCARLIINVPPRHGKSDQVSRRLPPHILCRQPDWEVILTTYGADLSEDLSADARKCFAEAGPKYGLRFDESQNSLSAWKVAGHKGCLFAVGTGGAVTGRGANVLIIDDYCKNRKDAESETIRKTVWDGFQSDLMTRLAPAHLVIILATRWHEDDLVGRILKAQEEVPNFPKFKLLNFPAQAADGSWLFPERFSPQFYLSMKALVGSYAWEALYQGNPKPRTALLLRVDRITIVSRMPEGLRWSRGWDLASSEAERIQENPDYTVGTKSAFDGKILYVADVVRGQWSAPSRDKRIYDTAIADGRGCTVKVEVVAGYKDTFTRMHALLGGKAIVRPVRPQGDKVARASAFEPLFEAGMVHVLRAHWNQTWIDELTRFPRGIKDDQVDSLVVSAADVIDVRGRMGMSR